MQKMKKKMLEQKTFCLKSLWYMVMWRADYITKFLSM